MQHEEPLVVDEKLACYHCGQSCDEPVWAEEKPFCCEGCKTVYELLAENNLCRYYALEKSPGIKYDDTRTSRFAYLDAAGIRQKVLTFSSNDFAEVTFSVPAIHCVSCIWLLENLNSLNKGIVRSEVNFTRKQVAIGFDPRDVQLSEIAALLEAIGYRPELPDPESDQKRSSSARTLAWKIAITGFCFGNVMLFSFPEYLGLDGSSDHLGRIFSWLNVVLSIPVLVYGGLDYLKAAAGSFRQRRISIDIPITIGLIALFSRSLYEVVTQAGPGYFDSFTGLVFFLLIGRWFQEKTYESLSFERDYKSYFPLAVHAWVNGSWKPVPIQEVNEKDRIRVHNHEIVPADAVLLDRYAAIDYSFVTGESRQTDVHQGDLVYAGGRLLGTPVELLVKTKPSQSHLTSLWNREAFQKDAEKTTRKQLDDVARIFTWAVLGIAAATGAYWFFVDPANLWLTITAVLIVACPCALALAPSFTYGSVLRVFGRHGLYLKNADVVERMGRIDTFVFDKTGTVIFTQKPVIHFHGELTETEQALVKHLAECSTHPLSKLIRAGIPGQGKIPVSELNEIPGKGIEGMVGDRHVRLGSASFVGVREHIEHAGSLVFVSIDNEPKGYFTVQVSVRDEFEAMLSRLNHRKLVLLSGDNEADKENMHAVFGSDVPMKFNQSPHDKLEYVSSLQATEGPAMMLGDGLNDAGALKESSVGIAITDDTGTFTPASDGILLGAAVSRLDEFMTLARSAGGILKSGFGISLLYNAGAIALAAAGELTPLVAAVLMPLSSITVVTFSTLAVRYRGSRIFNE